MAVLRHEVLSLRRCWAGMLVLWDVTENARGVDSLFDGA